MTTTPKYLWGLQVEDLEGVYDDKHGDGAWDNLDCNQKADIIWGVKKGLGYGFDSWMEVMITSLDETERNMKCDN